MQTDTGLPVSWPAGPAPDTFVVLDVDRQAFLTDFVRVLSGQPSRP
jgi:purine nucleosidase